MELSVNVKQTTFMITATAMQRERCLRGGCKTAFVCGDDWILPQEQYLLPHRFCDIRSVAHLSAAPLRNLCLSPAPSMAPAYATLRGVIVDVQAFLEETDGDLNVDSYEKVNLFDPSPYTNVFPHARCVMVLWVSRDYCDSQQKLFLPRKLHQGS